MFLRAGSKKIVRKRIKNTHYQSLEDEKSLSYWFEHLPETEKAQALKGKHQCDVAIIGGGFTGLSTAYHLRRQLPGIEVRLLEAKFCGSMMRWPPM